MEDNRFETIWDTMVEYGIVTDEELGLAVALCGRSINTLNDVLYIRTGYCDIEQFLGEEDDE